jgi:hypothetical protein
MVLSVSDIDRWNAEAVREVFYAARQRAAAARDAAEGLAGLDVFANWNGSAAEAVGRQQQWVQYTYEAQRFTQVNVGGPAWAPTSPDEIARTPGGVMTGGLAGIAPPPKIGARNPITLQQLSSLSTSNPTATYYIPDGCGGQFTFSGGAPVGGLQPPPVIPSMTAGG